ncbi:MAG TPA: tetratricopeptide repeat protein [Planctomycetota bacterium]|nr:tetratricopeptide repeat protein [Planctomycetota bacterium]
MSGEERAEDLFKEAYAAQVAGRLAEAAELYRRSIEILPTAEAHTFLGWTLSFMGRYAEAIAECRKAIEVDPDFGNPYNDIGAYLIELGRHDEAIPWLRRAMKAPRYDPRHYPHVNLSRIYVHRHEYDRAIRELERAVALDPGAEYARRELARLEARLN